MPAREKVGEKRALVTIRHFRVLEVRPERGPRLWLTEINLNYNSFP